MELLKTAIKSLLPRGRHYRRVRFGPAAGAVMPIDFAYQTRLFLGIYERELWPHFRALLRPGMRAFDIGAHDGYCALLIHRITRAQVVSFECEAARMPGLRETFARNSSQLAAEQAFIGFPASDGVTTLDGASRRHFFPDFIKMDVEGAEIDVLRGGGETLASGPSMIIEVHGAEVEEECRSLLQAHRYSVRIVDQNPVFSGRARALEHNRWLVCRYG